MIALSLQHNLCHGKGEITNCLVIPIILDNTAQIRTTHIYYFPEWLFMTRIFELFGVILCLVATTVQICFLPTRNIKIRSVAIYALGAAGKLIQ